jgi:hypothetical protein
MWFLIQGDARVQTNVALNRPAYQVSKLADPNVSMHGPEMAVDGSSGTNPDVDGCATTDAALYPWWAVDLGVPTHVGGIMFTNSNSTYGQYSTNFIVGVTDLDPVTNPPVPFQYELCGQYHAIIPNGATVSMQCERYPAPGRYVIVQYPSQLPATSLCEFVVYPRRFEWVRNAGQRMENRTLSGVSTVSQHLYCQLKCTMSTSCDSFNFNILNNTCELVTHSAPLQAFYSDISFDPNWEWWCNTFTVLK